MKAPYAAFGFSTLRYKGQHVMETSMGMEEFEEAYQTWLTEREESAGRRRCRISGQVFPAG